MMDPPSATAAVRPPRGRAPSPGTLRGLDWLNFFAADVQTGVGPFVAVYLASLHWSQSSIGTVLTVAGLTGVCSQLFGGALVDAVRHKRALLGASILAMSVSAVMLAIDPRYPSVLAAQVLHGVVGSVVGPAIAALSLGIVGYEALGERFGRNRRFDSMGNLGAAALMGVVGYVFSTRSIFWVTAALALPTLLALRQIRARDVDDELARGGRSSDGHARASISAMVTDRRFLIFMVCGVLFHFANAAMLPLLGAMLARGKERESSILLSACIMTTQVVVALVAPWIGRRAEGLGRKPLLILGFAVLPVRGVLYTLTSRAPLLIAIQLLDGIGVAVFGTLSALVVADLTRGSGRFNFAQGTVGIAIGLGASLSNAGAGYVVDHFGYSAGFLALSAVALVALLVLIIAMPETRPASLPPSSPSTPRAA